MTTRRRRAPSAPAAAHVSRPELDRTGPLRDPCRFLQAAPPGRSTRTAQRVVEAAVQGAYRVVDDYLRWGERTATRYAPMQATRTPMQYGSRGPSNPAAQWLEMWQQMYMQWMTTFVPPQANAMPPSSEIELDFGVLNRVARGSLRFGLLPPGGGMAQLSREDGDDALVVDIDEAGRFQLHVAANQHAGTYSGEIQDRYGAACGWMQVSIGS